jgi:hypothetical protein
MCAAVVAHLHVLLQAGRGVSMSPGALGPAAGRISVYEQRAKILFELSRAQVRATRSAPPVTGCNRPVQPDSVVQG